MPTVSAHLPVPRSARRVVLFGGTFDPPHRAHVRLAARARTLVAGPGAWLVAVPAARSPHKSSRPLAPDAHRVAMLRLALARTPRSGVWTHEIDLPPPNYWRDTLRHARLALGPAAGLWFVIGADQAAAFHRWRAPRAILRLAAPIVLPRAPIATPAELRAALRNAGFWTRREIGSWLRAMVPVRPVDSSATAARDSFRTTGTSPIVSAAVARYIRAHGLYAPKRGTRPRRPLT